jgi:imidazolonepropionase-like amidohydrolase
MSHLLLTADHLFDGAGSTTRPRPTLRIAAGRIEAVEQDVPVPTSEVGERFDFPGCTILPGMIDTHVHLVMSALNTNAAIIELLDRQSPEELRACVLANARAALHAGLTTIRDCGGKGRIVQDVREAIRRGQAEGPDILSCGMPITTRQGHCWWLGLTADTIDEVRGAAERMLAEQADFLKVMATGGNMTPSSEPMRAQYGPEALALIANIGRQAGKHAAAHVLSRSALPAVVAARYRTIEHCDWRVEEFRYEFDPELARRMIDQDQYAGITMAGTTRRAFLPEIASDTSPPIRRLDMRFACERRMIDFGVPFTLHSDAGVRLTPIDRFDLGLRTAQIELGLAPHEILRAVTRTAAIALGLNDRGVLTPGKRADLVVVEGDPLHDLASLAQVRAVMKEGQWVQLPAAVKSTR